MSKEQGVIRNVRKKYWVLVAVACALLGLLIFAGHLGPYDSVPKGEFVSRLFDVAEELNFKCEYVESTIGFSISDLPLEQRVLFKLTEQKEPGIKMSTGSGNTKILNVWSFANSNGGYFFVSSYEISNRVFLVKYEGDSKTNDFTQWVSKLQKAFPEVKIMEK